MEAPGKPAPVVVLVGLALLVVVVYLVMTRGGGGTAAGVVAGPSDAVQQAVLSAQTTFNTNATNEAIAQSKNASDALTSYVTATNGLTSSLATIRAQTEQAQIGATSAADIAGIQADAAKTLGLAQVQASKNASDAALAAAGLSAQTTVAVAGIQADAVKSAATSQATSQQAIAQAQKDAAVHASDNNLIGSIFSGIGAAFGL